MTTDVMASSDTSMNPRLSLASNKIHPSAGPGTARELPDSTADRRDSAGRTTKTTVPGSVTSKLVGGAVHATSNPAVVQILAASASASSSIRGTAPAALIRWTRRLRRAGAAQPVGARVGDGGDAAAPRVAAIDTRRKKSIEDLNGVTWSVSNEEHSAATHSSRTELVQWPDREAAG